MYRTIYYLLPLATALAILLVDEARQRRHQLGRAHMAFGALSSRITPAVLSAVTFLAGAVLLFSGATPANPQRTQWLAQLLPLSVFEASHFLGSVTGVALLVIARGVARRLRTAYDLAVACLIAGICASVLRATDIAAAVLLCLILAACLPAREFFRRRVAFSEIVLTPAWLLAMLCTVSSAVWLGIFAYKHVEYANELWWQFAFDQDASRYLRASVGTVVAALALGTTRLLRPAPHQTAAPGAKDLDDATVIIQTQHATMPYLALLADKSLLFNRERTAFLMYGVQGRTWTALGSPVGPECAVAVLVNAFIDRAADFDSQAVFYQVAPQYLDMYADLGMIFFKLGEEASVHLPSFTMAGRVHRGLRSTVHHVHAEQVRFRIVPANEVAPLLPALREISNQWLAHKGAHEKGFSLGRFDDAYLRRLPIAVMERAGQIEAFANLLPSADKWELSVDLMRYRPLAPKGIMDALFIELFCWGREQGYQWFNLGMAPLSGLDLANTKSLGMRFSRWLYLHGDTFYNFQGVRAFKEKFSPVWEPRYLTYPAGLPLARILTDIAALVAGGYRKLIR